jgi:hypothetical protein
MLRGDAAMAVETSGIGRTDTTGATRIQAPYVHQVSGHGHECRDRLDHAGQARRGRLPHHGPGVGAEPDQRVAEGRKLHGEGHLGITNWRTTAESRSAS